MTNQEAIEILQEEHEYCLEPCYVLNAIEKAISALRSEPTGEPLTLEQLREMDKPTPVWMELEEKAIEGWDGYWCLCLNGLISTPGHIVLHVDEIKKVKFYSYPPAHIDREAWEPCECCKPSENGLDPYGGHYFQIDGKEIYYNDTDDGWEGEEINFCPWCGRPLTEEAWAMLEKKLNGGKDHETPD